MLNLKHIAIYHINYPTGLTLICFLISSISFCRAILLSCFRAFVPSCYRSFVLSFFRGFRSILKLGISSIILLIASLKGIEAFWQAA